MTVEQARVPLTRLYEQFRAEIAVLQTKLDKGKLDDDP